MLEEVEVEVEAVAYGVKARELALEALLLVEVGEEQMELRTSSLTMAAVEAVEVLMV